MGLLVVKTLMVAYHVLVEPALAVGLRRTRLEALGAPRELPDVELAVGAGPGCSPECRVEAKAESAALSRYLRRPRRTHGGRLGRLASGLAESRKPTPMIVDLDRYPDVGAFEAVLRKRSNRTLAKARRAAEVGYRVDVFPRVRHTLDIHAIRTSKAVRSAGPMLDYLLLRPGHVGAPRAAPPPSAPRCPRHWTRWWGVFEDAPGHRQGAVTTDRRLVAYVKLRRIGDLVHYVDIMGHAAHLDRNVMTLLHLEIMRWLIARQDHAAGVRAVLYGAVEHGGWGLATWKKRAGFEPHRLARADDADARTVRSTRLSDVFAAHRRR